jgi:hypothetical protein
MPTLTAAPTIGQIKKALKDAASRIATARAYAVYPLDPKPPAMVPRLISWRHHDTFDGDRTYRFRLWVYLDPTDLNRAQTQLDDYLSDVGSNSVSRALETDTTLGDVVNDLTVIGGNDYGMVDTAGGQMLAGAVEVEILA